MYLPIMPPIKTSETWYANCSGSLLEMAWTSLHWKVTCTVYTEAHWVFSDSHLTLPCLSLYNLSLVHFCRPSRLRRHCHCNTLQTRLKGNSTIMSSYNPFVLYDTITCKARWCFGGSLNLKYSPSKTFKYQSAMLCLKPVLTRQCPWRCVS